MGALARLIRSEGIRGVIATAPADPGGEHDFVSRFFAPADGIPEDPVTGSAHTALAPYWAARLGREPVGCRRRRAAAGAHAAPRRSRAPTGHAVTVVDGTLHPEP